MFYRDEALEITVIDIYSLNKHWDVESMYEDIGGYDMKHDEFKETCRKAWSEKLNYLCIDMAKNKNEGKYRFFNESKNTYIECI